MRNCCARAVYGFLVSPADVQPLFHTRFKTMAQCYNPHLMSGGVQVSCSNCLIGKLSHPINVTP